MIEQIEEKVFRYFRDEILQAPLEVKEKMLFWDDISIINGLSGEDLKKLVRRTIEVTVRSANVPAEIINQMLKKAGVNRNEVP